MGISSRRSAWFLKAFAPHWWTYLQVMLAALMVNLFALASPLFIMNVYDRVLPNNSISSLWVMATGVLIVFGFDFLIRNLRSFFVDYAGKKVDQDLAEKVMSKVLDMQIQEKPASSGEYANLVKELETLRDFFTSATLIAVVDLPFVLIFIAIFYLIAGPLCFVLIATLTAILILGLGFHLPLQRAALKFYKSGHKKHSVIVETVSNLETIKAIRAENWFETQWKDAMSNGADAHVRTRFLSQFVVNATALIQQLAYVSIVILGVYLIQDRQMTTGALVACVILNGRAMAPMAQITLLLTRLNHAYSSFKGVQALMAKDVEHPEDATFLTRKNLVPDIEFRQVQFSYKESHIPALNNVSFNIRPGEKVGIIGRSGSGKTTVGRMLLGLYPLSGGSILMDKTDIRQLDPLDLRHKIGAVVQDIVLFQGTVRENIALVQPEADDEQILKAAQISGVDDFIRPHPMGYDLKIKERGEGLSGGQRQAIGIARALICEPDILVLDEPTSSMDNTSESVFRSRLASYLKNRTLVLITHRTSMLSLVDRIIVMDKGQIVADGPKEKIMEQLSGNRIRTGS